MKVVSLAHAGLRIEAQAVTVLVDPWMSPYGAYQGSWFQYPGNGHLLDIPGLFEPHAVVVSHEHLDHFDPWFIARLPLDVPLVTPRYPTPVIRQKAEAARPGGRLVEVEPWRWEDVAPGVRVLFAPEESPMNHDAAILLATDGAVILNLNDARLSPAQIRQLRNCAGGRIDALALQGAGASWYPMCYHYSSERKRELSQQKRLAKFAYALRAIRAATPSVVLPFAGPPCFLDPELFDHNAEMEGGIFPDQFEVAGWLRDQGIDNTIVLLPGDIVDLATNNHIPDARWSGFPETDRLAYLRAYAASKAPYVCAERERYPEPQSSLWEPFRVYFERLLSMNGYFNDRIGMRVGFDITGPGGGAWAVDFRPGSEGVYDELGSCQYIYRIGSRWLGPILDGRVAWEDFLLSLRFSAWRDPDTYSDHLLGLLKFAHPEPLAAVQRCETEAAAADRIVIRAEGRTWSVPRRCPHAGADLEETSEVLPGGILRCLNHYYEFDLATGHCLNGRCRPLDTVLLHVDNQASQSLSG